MYELVNSKVDSDSDFNTLASFLQPELVDSLGKDIRKVDHVLRLRSTPGSDMAEDRDSAAELTKTLSDDGGGAHDNSHTNFGTISQSSLQREGSTEAEELSAEAADYCISLSEMLEQGKKQRYMAHLYRAHSEWILASKALLGALRRKHKLVFALRSGMYSPEAGQLEAAIDCCAKRWTRAEKGAFLEELIVAGRFLRRILLKTVQSRL
eukprot:GHVU01163856.1.p1 GENE.GHVU01163856.1~~GHVU01163856.1.p1  ORF type:complete len:209 (-),score=19.56 GHVU01163856.1:585-1211(-)